MNSKPCSIYSREIKFAKVVLPIPGSPDIIKSLFFSNSNCLSQYILEYYLLYLQLRIDFYLLLHY